MPEREALPRRALVAIAGAGLVWRLVYVRWWGRDPLVFGDGLYYHLQAAALADGRGFIEPIKFAFLQGSHASATHPPLFSLVLFAVTRSGRALGLGSSDTTFVHQATCAVVSSLAVIVIGVVAGRVAGARAALLAAVIAAAYPPLWTSDALVMSESLYVLTIALVLLTFYALSERPTWPAAIVCGVAVGAATLTRSEAVLLVPILGVPFVCRRTDASRWRRAGALGAVVIAAALVCTPWIVRNARTFHRTVVLSENVDSVIAGANCAPTYYGNGIGSWVVSCNTSPTPTGDESDVGATLRHRGLHYAGAHLTRVPLVVAARVGRTFLLFNPFADRTESGRSPWTQWVTIIAYVPVQALAVLGAVLLRRRRVVVWPFLAMGALVLVTTSITYGISRFRIPWDVASVVLAAVAVDHFAAAVRTRARATG